MNGIIAFHRIGPTGFLFFVLFDAELLVPPEVEEFVAAKFFVESGGVEEFEELFDSDIIRLRKDHYILRTSHKIW